MAFLFGNSGAYENMLHLVNKAALREYVKNTTGMYDFETGEAAPAGDSEFEINRAAGYLALAALDEAVLLEVNKQVELLTEAESYGGRLKALLYAAAYCVIGDDTAAVRLLEKYGLNGADDGVINANFSGAESETLGAALLFVQSVTNPPAAFENLKARENTNTYVSDVLEKLHFLRTVVPVAGISSEVEYTLDGKTNKVKLIGFDCMRLDISPEQYEGLNVTWVSGNTGVEVFFTGTPENLNPEQDGIDIIKTIEPVEGYEGLYRVNVRLRNETWPSEIDGNDGLSNYLRYYTVYDRFPAICATLSPLIYVTPVGGTTVRRRASGLLFRPR